MFVDIERIRQLSFNFIVCGPRTGSTLLSTMLNMHSDVLSPIEEPFAYNLYAKYHSVKNWTSQKIKEYCDDFFLFSDGLLSYQFISKEEFRQTLNNHKDQLDYELVTKLSYFCFIPLKPKESITTVVDKQLKMSIYLDKAALMFPQAKFILLYRNPLDNVPRRKKMFENKKDFTQDKNVKLESFMYSAMNWNYDYGLIMKAREKIAPERILNVKYENLILQPEKEMRRICDFLSISYQESMLEYTGPMKQAIQMRVSQNAVDERYLLNHMGITRKPDPEKIGTWKTSIPIEVADTIWSICGRTAEKMGYTKDALITVRRKPLQYYLLYPKLFYNKICISELWFALPFSVQALIKGLKYGKNMRNRWMPSPAHSLKT